MSETPMNETQLILLLISSLISVAPQAINALSALKITGMPSVDQIKNLHNLVKKPEDYLGPAPGEPGEDKKAPLS